MTLETILHNYHNYAWKRYEIIIIDRNILINNFSLFTYGLFIDFVLYIMENMSQRESKITKLC
jgi:hypothetical protein